MVQLMGVELMAGIVVVCVWIVVVVVIAIRIVIIIAGRLRRIVEMRIEDARRGAVHRSDELYSSIADHAQHL